MEIKKAIKVIEDRIDTIKRLKKAIGAIELDYEIEALEMGVAALKKDVAIKPYTDSKLDKLCPVCYANPDYADRCRRCGQLIDWSEFNNEEEK